MDALGVVAAVFSALAACAAAYAAFQTRDIYGRQERQMEVANSIATQANELAARVATLEEERERRYREDQAMAAFNARAFIDNEGVKGKIRLLNKGPADALKVHVSAYLENDLPDAQFWIDDKAMTVLAFPAGHEQTIHYGCRQWAAYPLYLTVTWETAAATEEFKTTLMVMPETVE